MRNVCIIAGGMSQWGVRDASQRDCFQEAGKACFEDNKGVTNKDIDGLLVASAYTERCSFQTHLAPLVAEYLGIKPKSVCARVELLCASGSSARNTEATRDKPCDAVIMAIVDTWEVDGREVYRK